MAAMMPTIPSDMMQMLSRMERFLGGAGTTAEDEGTLALDIYEADDALVVEASVPGFQRDDIAIQLHQGLLSIVASRQPQETATSDRRYFRRERPVGSWTRRIALPGIVHDAEVDAELKDGVLTLRIPVPASAKPRQIEIRTGTGAWGDASDLAIEAGSQDGDREAKAEPLEQPATSCLAPAQGETRVRVSPASVQSGRDGRNEKRGDHAALRVRVPPVP